MVLLWYGLFWCGGLWLLLLLESGDFVVLVVGQDADQGHHAHHFGGPVFWEAVGFGFGDDGVHAHLHEGVLREAFYVVGVFGDGGVVDVLEADGFGERHHLAEGLRDRFELRW